MEASAQSSKVTVEYHDPSGVFPLVSDDIFKRLPLRNLNWQSPSRPLRQIKSLHVEFVADNATQNSLRPPSARPDNHGPNSFEIVSGGVDAQQNAAKERRHQIPGLKNSPYLKIYVLRCDDSESYKESERKRVRDWVRETSGKDGRRDNHDAFEWMILHVVIPDTVAASEPRWRDSSSKESDELKERPKSNSKWPGKSTKTVFDRLRADFNESGKSAQDRVAQIRLLKSEMSLDLLPTPAVAPTLEESPSERENAWHDLISKFKSFILGPFDLRVRQYESDIAEQESRRALPGWNFCTFFIHKEGLAKALESIGLVQDALAIYDELSIGLEAIVRDMATGKASGTATTFAPFTDDIEDRILGSTKSQMNGTHHNTAILRGNDASELFAKDYRKLIVTSNISVFDFLCYIFSRQKALILRLANARSMRAQLVDREKDGGEDLVLTAEVCWRASSFIHISARMLRRDLDNYAASRSIDSTDADHGGLVCSWTYAIAGQVLQETAVSVLQDIIEPNHRMQAAAGSGPRRRVTMTLGVGADAYPQRSTSLPGRKPYMPELKRPPSRSSSGGTTAFRPQSSPGSDHVQTTGYPGQADLATNRAELVLMRRRVLERLAAKHGWYAGWASVKSDQLDKLHDVDLNSKADHDAPEESSEKAKEKLNPSLEAALESADTFRTTFEQCTDLAIRHYSAATQSKSAESLMGDMAILKTQSGDFSGALTYFDRIVPRYSAQSWDIMELQALKLYSNCLKGLRRSEEYTRSVLSLLTKSCNRRSKQAASPTSDGIHDKEYVLDVSGMLTELITYSNTLPKGINVDAEDYFAQLQLLAEVKTHRERDGFSLELRLQYLLDDKIDVEPSARLVSVDDPSLEIWLHAEAPVTLQTGWNTVSLHASTVACGAFLIDQIIIWAGKLRFQHNPQPKGEASSLTTAETKKDKDGPGFRSPPFVYVYPSENAFNVQVQQAKHTHIGKPRKLEITLESGHNDISSIHLKMKPNLAGLRLHLADAITSDIELSVGEGTSKGQISLGQLKPQARATVSIPYTLEQNAKDVSVRLEVNYATPTGSCVFLSTATATNSLPLDVDVNDHFHLGVLFSQFTVRAIDQAPLSIVEAHLGESAIYSVESPPFTPLPTTVYNSQPMQLVYQVRQKPPSSHTPNKRNAALSLQLKYQTVCDMFHEHFRDIFAQDLRSSPHASLSRLLVLNLTERSKGIIRTGELELAAIMGLLKLPSFDRIGWDDVLITLNPHVRENLRLWLHAWHAQHQQIDISSPSAFEAASRTITIDVDVPKIDIVFGCSLDLINPSKLLHHGYPIVSLGSPIEATVHAKYTNTWNTKRVANSTADGPDFACEIVADADTWLVGGQRRSHFTIKQDGEHTFKVVLIPLQTGCHALPFVDIRLALSNSDESNLPEAQPPVTYENHFESAGRFVQVIRDARTSRVEIVEDSAIPDAVTPGPSPSVQEAG